MDGKITAKIPWFLIIVLLGAVLLRLPSLYEPRLYGDEQIYLTVGMGIKKGLVLYKQIYDNKPPLIYLLAGAQGSLVRLRLLLLVWSLLTITLFYDLAKNFGKDERVVKLATIIFALVTSLPMWEGGIANAEIFLILGTIAAWKIATDIMEKKGKWGSWLGLGVIFGLAILFKVPAIFDVGGLGVGLLLLIRSRGEVWEWFKRMLEVGVGVMIPVGLSFAYFIKMGAAREYFESAFIQLFPYLGSWQGGSNKGLLMRGVILLVVLAGLRIATVKKIADGRTILIGSWLVFSLFAALLSGRPYPHYLIQLTPALALAVALAVYKSGWNRKLMLMGIFLVMAGVGWYRFWVYPPLPYYKNWLEFAAGRISREEYSIKTNPDWEWISKIITYVAASTKEGDRIFVWGTNPEIYAYSGRLPATKYTVAYHIRDFKAQQSVADELAEKKPKLIILIKSEGEIKELDPLLKLSYMKSGENEKVTIWRRIWTR